MTNKEYHLRQDRISNRAHLVLEEHTYTGDVDPWDVEFPRVIEVAAGSREACLAAKRLLTMFACIVLVCLASGAQAQDTGPDADTVYAPLVLCISPYVVSHDRQVMARAAVARGYDVFVGHSKSCSVTVFVGDGDVVGSEWISYNEGRKLHRGRATDLLIAWEARL